MSKFKPMLAGKAPADLADLKYPVLASPKLDGIRCVIRDGVAMSRSLKPIPNDHVRAALAGLPDGMDGELMVAGGFSACSSFFMSKHKVHDDWWFHTFDWDRSFGIPVVVPFQDRLEELTEWSETNGHNNLCVVEHVLISNEEELLAYEVQCISQGFEGIMIRDPDGPYKYGRSTTKQGILLKRKLFWDEEAEIIGLEEQMHNENEASCNECGYTERSSHKENMVPAGTLGKFNMRFRDGTEFKCGGGPNFTAVKRQAFWDQRNTLDTVIGQYATVRFQPEPEWVKAGQRPSGSKPRIPQYHGIRHPEDS